MTTSKPSQPPLFADGSESANAATMFPTPKVSMDHGSPSELRRNTPSLAAQINHNLHSLPPAIPASHSLSPGSAWARKMAGISGRSLRRWLPNSVLAGCFWKMFTDTSRWGSTRCYLTWKRSATPAGRSLFRLVPSAPPTGGIGSGFWRMPEAMDIVPTPTAINRPHDGQRQTWRRLARKGQVTKEEAQAAINGKLSAAWVSRLMGYPDSWLDLPED